MLKIITFTYNLCNKYDFRCCEIFFGKKLVLYIAYSKVDVNVKVGETGCTCFFQAGIQRQPIKNLIAQCCKMLGVMLGFACQTHGLCSVHSSVNDTIVLADTFRNFFMPADTVKMADIIITDTLKYIYLSLILY